VLDLAADGTSSLLSSFLDASTPADLPDMPRFLYAAGVACLLNDDLDRAESLIRRVVNALPDSLQAVRRLVAVYRRQGRYRAAVALCHRALSRPFHRYLDPEHALCHDIGLCLQQAGHLTWAHRWYRHAYSRAPHEADTCYNLGCLDVRRGRFGQARTWFKRAIRNRPDDAGGHSNLGACLARLGHRRSAAASLSRALELDPGLKSARANLERLTSGAMPRGTSLSRSHPWRLLRPPKTGPSDRSGRPAGEMTHCAPSPARVGVDMTLIHLALPEVGNDKKHAPLGCLCLMSALRRDGLSVELRDLQLLPDSRLCGRDHLQRLAANPAPIVGIGCLADTLPHAVILAKGLKRRHPDVFIVLGGPGPSGVAAPLISSFNSIDIVVRGEGEDTLAELAHHLLRQGPRGLGAIRGINYREDGEPRQTPDRSRIDPLDDTQPAFDQVDLTAYDVVNLATARGCPFTCTFCDVAPLWGRKVTVYEPETVARQIQCLADRGVRHVGFTDDTFVLSPRRVRALCRAMDRVQPRVVWNCFGRIDLMTPALLETMAAAGCASVFYGIESGSDDLLARLNKGFTTDGVSRVVDMTQRLCHVKTSFIWGYPEETVGDLRATLMMVAYLSETGVETQLARLAPLPLSTIYGKHRDRLIYRRQEEDGAIRLRAAPDLYPAVEALVRAYPTVFPAFRSFGVPDYQAKRRLCDRFYAHWVL